MRFCTEDQLEGPPSLAAQSDFRKNRFIFSKNRSPNVGSSHPCKNDRLVEVRSSHPFKNDCVGFFAKDVLGPSRM